MGGNDHMKETKTEGLEGYTYRHFIENNIESLKELKRQYEAMGKRAWLNKIGLCGNQILIVEEIEI
jgi:hypothetical protein